MNEKWWERPAAFVNDYGWLLLLAIIGLSGLIFRGYWVPSSASFCFNGTTEIKLNDVIPYSFHNLDIVFAFDQSASMENMIDGAKQDASKLMQTLGARIGTQNFGVAGFSDYIDMPYALYQPLTGNYADVQSAIDKLTLYNGGDPPEACGRLMYESYSDVHFGWRSNSTHYLIIFGDSVPHDPDAGRDGVLGSADDLVLNKVLAGAAANHITVIYVSDPGVFYNTSVLNAWEDWTKVTGGRVVPCHTVSGK